MAKIGHDAKAIALAKCSVMVRNKKCRKGVKNDCKTTLELLCVKNRPQNTQNSKNWPRRKGSSLSKIVSLGQKLKNAKKVWKTIVRPH